MNTNEHIEQLKIRYKKLKKRSNLVNNVLKGNAESVKQLIGDKYQLIADNFKHKTDERIKRKTLLIEDIKESIKREHLIAKQFDDTLIERAINEIPAAALHVKHTQEAIELKNEIKQIETVLNAINKQPSTYNFNIQ